MKSMISNLNADVVPCLPEIARAIAEEIWPDPNTKWYYFCDGFCSNSKIGYAFDSAGGYLKDNKYILFVKIIDNIAEFELSIKDYLWCQHNISNIVVDLSDPSSIVVVKLWLDQAMAERNTNQTRRYR